MSVEAVEVIAAPAAAIVALDPVRSRLLAELREPRSATELARTLDLPRQRVHYHVRQLEAQGLVTGAGERRWGGLTERLLVATAGAYLVSPEVLGAAAARPTPGDRPDRLSAAYLVALAGRVVQEVGALLRRSRETGRPAETFTIDADITFRTPSARADFVRDLTEAVATVIARHHVESGSTGRRHRLVIGAYPIPQNAPADAGPSEEQNLPADAGPSKEQNLPADAGPSKEQNVG
ncbi:Helix-turn-helix domain-containing protein [Micromonospora pallida]|uniref:Helix-turn-helix domain-containing protein n=1 Tax=Micromonospora pallida TaxID=145854 RepID=A0A1C6RRA7_9ACTN|nr:helix-turn-helix domain-containing protein [Micromonospora pallida]SCL19559.1 Helix-turn-helix domain-containing protein [Micromonospora pallida]